LLVACRGQSPEATPATEAPLVVRTAAPIVQPTAAPVATSQTAEAAPSAAPGVSRAAPKGKFTEAYNATIPPAWLDPQENPPQVTPYHFDYALHDALVKHMPGKEFAPSLAESYEIAPDYMSAVFKLRPGIKFHDGSKVTSEDVQFTYEHYRGASAPILKSKLDRIELLDERTVEFFFNEPFLDFLTLYGSPASGAGWVVPKAYYEKVGPNGYKLAPIGAGPYRFVRQSAGTEVELEAFTDYWRKAPSVKTIVWKGVPEVTTRVAMLKTGDVDAAVTLQGELLDSLRRDSSLRLTATLAASTWLEFGLDRPDHPLKDVRVRRAVSLAVDRQAINDAQFGGVAPSEGNWIPEDWQGALKRTAPPTDIGLARKMLAEAGVPDGFEVSALTPLPPFTDWGERVLTQLRVINIKTQLNAMDRGAFYERMAPGPNRLKGLILMFSSAPGDAAARIREDAACNGSFSGLCLPEVDDRMKAFDTSTDLARRKQLLDEVQAYLLDQYVMVPVLRGVLITGFGPRVAGRLEDISGAIPQYIWIGPWEDLQVTDAT
jgi:peptide/nickel transport system substrate-binding protein